MNDTRQKAEVQGREGSVKAVGVRKSESGGQTFIVTVPEKIEELVFTVSASAKRSYLGSRQIFWLRARAVGQEDWSQTLWAEMEDQEGGLFISNEIYPTALWMVPKTTYEVEVVPERMEVHDFNLNVQMKAKEGEKVMVRERVVGKGSWLDNPMGWLTGMIALFILILYWMMRGK